MKQKFVNFDISGEKFVPFLNRKVPTVVDGFKYLKAMVTRRITTYTCGFGNLKMLTIIINKDVHIESLANKIVTLGYKRVDDWRGVIELNRTPTIAECYELRKYFKDHPRPYDVYTLLEDMGFEPKAL